VRGYQISVDGSRDGNRERFVELGELAERIGAALGTVVEGDEADELLDEGNAAGEPPMLASMVVITLYDGDDRPIESASVYLDHFAGFMDAGGLPSKASAWKPALMSEDHCYEVRGKTMTAVMHDSAATPFRRYEWRLDGYGRIAGVEIVELRSTECGDSHG
jgi:hypothetical protein